MLLVEFDAVDTELPARFGPQWMVPDDHGEEALVLCPGSQFSCSISNIFQPRAYR